MDDTSLNVWREYHPFNNFYLHREHILSPLHLRRCTPISSHLNPSEGFSSFNFPRLPPSNCISGGRRPILPVTAVRFQPLLPSPMQDTMMEFWGVEVKSGEALNCDPGFDKYLHISQAALGEMQNAKENERVRLYVRAGAREFLIGTLTYGKCDQISLDIVFDKEFKLSHSCTKGSVFFCGYTTVIQGDEVSGSDEEGSSSESEDAKQAQALKHTLKENEAKPARLSVITSGAKPAKAEAVTVGKADKNAKAEEVKAVGEKSMDEDEDEDEDESEDEDEDDDEEMGDSSDEDGSDESGDASDENKSEKAPKAEPAAKKRPLPDSTTKSFAIGKKKKVTAAGGVQKTGKKGESEMLGGKPGLIVKPQTPSTEVQTSKVKGKPDAKETPKPSAKPGTEKKVGVHTCIACSRNFATESALNQHNNAKHKSN